jgi:hypothetical protein
MLSIVKAFTHFILIFLSLGKQDFNLQNICAGLLSVDPLDCGDSENWFTKTDTSIAESQF